MIARILTPWTGSGATAQDARRPQLTGDHPLEPDASCVDVTGQLAGSLPPEPNLFTVEVRGVSQAWLDAVDADAVYQVLWSE